MKSIYLLFVLTFFGTLLSGQVAIAPTTGNGSSTEPYQIGTLENLYWIAAEEARWDKHFIQTANIDASETSGWFDDQGWLPIGNSAVLFNGSYNGQGYSITGLTILRSDSNYLGLFGMTKNAVLKNIVLANVSISGRDIIGGLVGLMGNNYGINAGSIFNCQVSGTITGSYRVGGLAGISYDPVQNSATTEVVVNSNWKNIGGLIGESMNVVSGCAATGQINLGKSAMEVGGLIGQSYDNVENCHAEVDVSGGQNAIGGLIGVTNNLTIVNCSATGNITADTDFSYKIGGLIGLNYSHVINSHASGSVSGGYIVGGLIGENLFGQVEKCFSNGSVVGVGFAVGGLVGGNQGEVINSYSHASVTGHNYVGGFVGNNFGRAISNSYSNGHVFGEGENVGGFAGGNVNDGPITSSYWDTETSGMTTSFGGEGRLTAEMTYPYNDENTYIGWDFTEVWDIDDTSNNGYPWLKPVEVSLVWTGAVSIAWENPENWSGGALPNTDDSPVIAPAANNPLISSQVEITDLTIQADAGLTIGSIGELTVSSTFINNAGYAGLLIKAGGSLINNAQVSGTMQWSPPGNSWHFLSAPVNGMTILDSDFAPAGPDLPTNFDLYYFAQSEPTAPWINLRDENDLVNDGFEEFFHNGKGYLVAYSQAYITEYDLDHFSFEGQFLSSGVGLNLAYTAGNDWVGWNLIGNPYPSGIDWAAALAANTNRLSSAFAYIYNGTIDNYEYQDDGILAPGQGFFVMASAEGPFEFLNNLRVHGGQYTKPNEAQDLLVLQFSNATHADNTSIRIIEYSEFSRDFRDAIKMFSFASHMPQVYSYTSDQVAVAINSVPNISEEAEFTLGMRIPATGEYTLSVNEISGVFGSGDLFLKDLITGVVQDLQQSPQFSFQALQGDDPARFEITFSQPSNVPPIGESLVSIYTWGDALHINFTEEAPNRLLEIFDLSGRLVLNQKLDHGFSHTQQLNLEQGAYIVRISSPAGVATQKVIVK